MVKAQRKKVAAVVLAPAAAAVIPFAAHPVRDTIQFARLSSSEKKVVGEWKTYSIGGVIVNTLRADHTWTSVGGCLPDAGPTHGWWKVEGTEVVYEIDQREFADMPAIGPFRQPIQQLIADDQQVRSWADRSSDK